MKSSFLLLPASTLQPLLLCWPPASEGLRLSQIYKKTHHNLGTNNVAFEFLFPLSEAPSLGLCRNAFSLLRLLCLALPLRRQRFARPEGPGPHREERLWQRDTLTSWGWDVLGCLLIFFPYGKGSLGTSQQRAVPRGWRYPRVWGQDCDP